MLPPDKIHGKPYFSSDPAGRKINIGRKETFPGVFRIKQPETAEEIATPKNRRRSTTLSFMPAASAQTESAGGWIFPGDSWTSWPTPQDI
jgi:hypothetical protein